VINYGNRGGRLASGVRILDNIFSGLDILNTSTSPSMHAYDANTHSGYWNVYDLVSGQTGQITVMAQLNDRYDAGTQLPNEVWIGSESSLLNT
jgi:hypothetical protein